MKKRNQVHNQEAASRGGAYLCWVVVILAMVFAAILRVRLLHIPLDRDEGEYAYMGRLMMQGYPPYVHAYSMKLPGIYAVYALAMMLFGQTDAGIHLALLIVNAATTVLLFLLGRRLFDSYFAAVSAVSFVFFTLSPSVHGLVANAEHFILPLVLGGIILMLRSVESAKARTMCVSGLLLGLAFTVKQHGVFFIPFAILYYLWIQRRDRSASWTLCFSRLGVFAAGVIIPYVLVCLVFLCIGHFSEFWRWTFTLAHKYTTALTLPEGWQMFSGMAPRVFEVSLVLWVLAAVGMTAFLWDAASRKRTAFILPFTLFSAATVFPGLYFREHYYLLLIPAASLLVGIMVLATRRLLQRTGVPILCQVVPILLFLGAVSHSVHKEDGFLFVANPQLASRMIYGGNPFPEAVEVGKYIRDHSSPGDRIAVLGSEPEILFYANRRSATGYIYTYPLMDAKPHALKMQREMIGEIEAARPEFLIFVAVPTSWVVHDGSPTHIFEWSTEYRRKHYEMVGVADILALDYTQYYWGAEAVDYVPQTDLHMVVLRRRQ